MTRQDELANLDALRRFYRAQLLDDVTPFWLKHSLDREYGGYLTTLDRDGAPHGTGKYIWPQARGAYLFAKLYNEVEPREEYLEAARLGIEFLDKHAVRDNRAFYKCTRDGRPLYARSGEIFVESFAVIAYAHYARAARDERCMDKARSLFASILERMDSGELDAHLETKLYQEHAPGMIMINCAQELRAVNPNPTYTERIAQWVEKELFTFGNAEHRALFERVGLDGSPVLSEPEGRTITPGHGMESAWFCLEEGLAQHDQRIIDRAVDVIRWTIERGWDAECGGVVNYIDLFGKPPGHHDEDWGEHQDWDEKIFWPHAESLYALLLAYLTTGDEALWDWYVKVHEWTFDHFPDPEYGEWFGYLRRDGSISQTQKGCTKGFFHVPRALLKCMQALERHNDKEN